MEVPTLVKTEQAWYGLYPFSDAYTDAVDDDDECEVFLMCFIS
jgi:hypothetical protein